MREVVAIAHATLPAAMHGQIRLSADTNEQCAHPGYMVELLSRLREQDPVAYEAVQYVEQPTERDLLAHRWDMRELAALKPVILDESLTTLADIDLAVELGWSGIALKACKTQSASLLALAKTEAMGLPYTIQDLTNPGIALTHSAGLAARCRPLNGLEANACQFFPATCAPEATVHPHLFSRRGGHVITESLRGPGLGHRVSEIPRPLFLAAS
jgi:L-alanine-DL-glutamate epimerase-like enolase superfamily enzyme